jgi:hypothetical protein
VESLSTGLVRHTHSWSNAKQWWRGGLYPVTLRSAPLTTRAHGHSVSNTLARPGMSASTQAKAAQRSGETTPRYATLVCRMLAALATTPHFPSSLADKPCRNVRAQRCLGGVRGDLSTKSQRRRRAARRRNAGSCYTTSAYTRRQCRGREVREAAERCQIRTRTTGRHPFQKRPGASNRGGARCSDTLTHGEEQTRDRVVWKQAVRTYGDLRARSWQIPTGDRARRESAHNDTRLAATTHCEGQLARGRAVTGRAGLGRSIQGTCHKRGRTDSRRALRGPQAPHTSGL